MAIMSIVYCNFGGRIAHSVVPSATPVKRDYIPDTLGSVSRVMGPGQTVISSFTYTPYGEITTSTGPRQNLEFVGTLGYYRDRFVAALTYVRARWYQASLARWLTVDPLWPRESAYRYVNSKPNLLVDPLGLRPATPCEYEDCFFKLVLGSPPVSPFGACVRCLGEPSYIGHKKCAKLSIHPLTATERERLRKLLNALTANACAPCNPYSLIDECCTSLAVNLAAVAGQIGVNETSGCWAAGCIADCEKLIGKSGDITMMDLLKAFEQCIKPKMSGPLDMIKILIEGIHAVI